MKEQTREDPKIMAAAERQMHAWAMNEEIADRNISRKIHLAHIGRQRSFVSISRESGAGGSELAAIIGKRLGWEVWDKNLLDHVAERFHLDRSMLALVDETPHNWIYDVLGTWMDNTVVPHEKYVSLIKGVIQSVSQLTNLIVVGRAAQFILPRESTLAVRLVASEGFRLKRIMQSQKLNKMDALKYIHERDQGRHEFVQRFFHHDVNDSHIFDMVINTERFGIAGAAEIIINTMNLVQSDVTKKRNA